MTNDIKILAILISYYPDLEQTRGNILQFIDYIDTLIIWENTPEKERDRFRIDLPEYNDKINNMGCGENMCIAFPLNEAVRYARLNQFTHLLTMDQDSFFETGHFKRYIEIVDSLKDKILIFGPNPNHCDPNNSDTPTEVRTLITSGNIIKVDIFDSIGLYREDYKIDCIDYEFCFRAARNGYKCFMISSILLNHEFGKLQKTKLGFYISNYSPFRLYYIAKNNIKLYREYPEFIHLSTVLSRIIKPFVKIIISEPNKTSKLVALFRGSIKGINSENSILNIK